jgi:hypothetical protein
MGKRTPGGHSDPQQRSAMTAGRMAMYAAIIAALITAVATVAVGLIDRPSGQPHLKAATTGPCPDRLTITSPVAGQDVTGRDGVRVLGTACGLAGADGWLFDHDGEDPYYYEVFPDDPGPAVTRDGAWTTIDEPIGGPGDNDKTYDLTLVLASPACDHALRALRPTDGDYKTLAFPTGCRVVRQVPVSVTY